MFTTLKNAWRIPELKKKLLFTLFIIVLYRLGANILVPYVNPDLLETASFFSGGNILQFLNMLSGGALSQATLLALGVSPYITASIVMQLLTIAIPALERLSKQGEEGMKKITAITCIVTVALALVTSIAYTRFIVVGDGYTSYFVGERHFFKYVIMVACFCAGASLVMWLAEKINESGIGNGISMILFANIIASMSSMFASLWNLVFPATGFRWWGIPISLAEIALIIGIIMFIVWMTNAERRIPIQYAKRVVGRKMYGGQNTHLPIKVNMSGVMPIIFANSIVALPSTIALIFQPKTGSLYSKVINFLSYGNVDQYTGEVLSANWPYVILFVVLIIAFAYFYISISFNPVEVSNNLKKNGGFIPGIRPGKPTSDYISKVLNRIVLIGAFFLCLVAAVPMMANIIAGFTLSGIAFSGSSLLIVVGVAIETTREIEGQMTMRHYKGFLE